jgi:hypothetical protein
MARERESYFDDRLYTHGIDAVFWDDARSIDHEPRTVTLRFPVENTEPVEIAQRLMPNAEESEYHSITVNKDLLNRGVRDIRVKVSRKPFVQSDIYITVEGEPEPLRVILRC